MRYLGAITNDYDLVTKKYVDDATEVIQTLTSGTKIGSVGGVNLYAPTGGGGSGTVTSVGITNGGGLSVSGSPVTSSGSITVGHSNSVTAGTIGSTSATSGASISIPYATYDSNGHITGKGTHTHTITGFLDGTADWNSNHTMTIGGYRLQYGTISINPSSGTSGSGTWASPYRKDSSSITLNGFSAAPFVWLQVSGSWTGPNIAYPLDVTASSFKIRLISASTSDSARTIRWLAIGQA